MENPHNLDFFDNILHEDLLDNGNVNNFGRRHSNNNPSPTSVWVFGYGSLCWYPGFDYTKCITGYIRGYSRKFWQGNTTHRGTPDKPGLVATLVEDKEGITWGCAYKIIGDAALDYLKQRECTLGGYVTFDTKFFPRIAYNDTEGISGEALKVVIYIATEESDHWMGESSQEKIAQIIVESHGPSGHNVEYLLRLAAFMREEIPDAQDEHLFELERLVREKLDKHKIPLNTVMGITPRPIRRDSHEEIRRSPTFEYASRVPERKLRCLNI